MRSRLQETFGARVQTTLAVFLSASLFVSATQPGIFVYFSRSDFSTMAKQKLQPPVLVVSRS